jgi:hypothetical protein
MFEKLEHRIRKLGSWLHFFLVSTFCILGAALLFYVCHVCIQRYAPPTAADSVILYAFKLLPKEITLALVIAWVLGFSVEYWNNERHARQLIAVDDQIQRQHREVIGEARSQHQQIIRDVSQNVFRAVYGRDIPGTVFEMVEKQVLNASLFRQRSKLELIFRRVQVNLPGSTGTMERVKIAHRQSFTTHNVSGADYKWNMKVTLDLHVYGQSDAMDRHFQYLHFKVFADGGDVPSGVWKFASNSSDGQTDIRPLIDGTGDGVVCLSRTIDIPKNGRVEVDVRYDVLYALDGADVVCVMDPSDGIEVNMTIPGEDLVVQGMSLHPEEEVMTSDAEDRLSRTFEVRHGFVPGQGFYYRWYPRSRN